MNSLPIMQYIPDYYNKSTVMAAILLPHQNELQRIISLITDTEKQMLICSATSALDKYEADLGIVTNLSESYSVRRSRILAKLRGLGTVSKSTLISVINSFVAGEIEITEHYSNYTVTIKFVSKKGIPNNMGQIKSSINEIIPAHLQVNYIYTYRTWNDIKKQVHSWNEANAYTWDSIRVLDDIIQII